MRTPRLLLPLLVALALLVTAVPASGAPKRDKRPQPEPVAAVQADRALFVWDRPATRTLVRTADQAGIDALFVHVPETLGSLTWLRDLRKRATAAGMTVSALGGAPDWPDRPNAALAWQREALATGLFDGIHLDVEPWVRADWTSDRAGVVADYLALLELMAGDTAAPVEADVAFWLHEITTADGGRLDAAVLARVDAVTVLSYRDTATGPDSITGLARTTLDAAAAAGKPARLAVETGYLGDDAVAQKQTFHGETRSRLDAVLAEVDQVEAGHSAYAGIAIHHWTSWSSMRR